MDHHDPVCQQRGHIDLYAEKIPEELAGMLKAQRLHSGSAQVALDIGPLGDPFVVWQEGAVGLGTFTARLQQRDVTLREVSLPTEDGPVPREHEASRFTGLVCQDFGGLGRIGHFTTTRESLPVEATPAYQDYRTEYDAAVDDLMRALGRFQRAYHANPYAADVPEPYAFSGQCKAVRAAQKAREKRINGLYS